MTKTRRTVFHKPVGIHVAVLMLMMSAAVAAAGGFAGHEKTGTARRRVNTPCDGIDLDATGATSRKAGRTVTSSSRPAR